MNRIDHDFLSALGGDLDEGPSWRCLFRNGNLLVVFRSTGAGARRARELYSPQRLVAKLAVKALLGPLGLWRVLPKIQWGADPKSLLAVTTGCEGVNAEAILLGNPKHEARRAIVLGNGKVLKIGGSGKAADFVRKEAHFLKDHGSDLKGVPLPLGYYEEGQGAALSLPHFSDGALSREELVAMTQSWLDDDELAIEQLEGWEMVTGSSRDGAKQVADTCRGISLKSSLMHGDLAPWNVRMTRAGNPIPIDWEGGRIHAVPGWDLIHYIFQTLVLVERRSPDDTLTEIMAFLGSPRSQNYLIQAGWQGRENFLFASYLIAMATEDSHITPILERLLNSPTK